MHKDETPIIIDLDKLKGDQLNESFLRSFGSWVKSLLGGFFEGLAGNGAPVKVRGRESDLTALAGVLGREKRYMESYLKYGLNDPRVIRSRNRLENAVYSFERETGIKWPLK